MSERAEALFQRWLDASERGESLSPEELAEGEPEAVRDGLRERIAEFEEAFQLLRGPAGGMRPGARLGPYRIERHLGAGGIGEVWEAVEVGLERRVALKLLKPLYLLSERARTRFAREAQAASRIAHPAVVRVYASGEVDGTPFLATELVPGGRTLRDLMDAWRHERRTDAAHYRHVAEIFRDVADGLAAVHAAGIVHRDLKPSNVLMDDAGLPRLADFGTARVEGDLTLTENHSGLGTPRYMAPEACRGSARVDAAADLFSFGATLYEALTCLPAFEGDTREQVADAISHDEPGRPRDRRSSVPRDLETVCLRCLEKKPSRRPPSAKFVAEELQRFLERRPLRLRPPRAPERLWRAVERRPWRAAAAATLCVGLTVGILQAWTIQQRSRELTDVLEETGAWVSMIQPESFGPRLALGAKALKRQRDVILASEHLDGRLRAKLLKDVGRGLVYVEDFETARAILRLALEEAPAEGDGDLRAEIGLYLGWSLARTSYTVEESLEAARILQEVIRAPGAGREGRLRELWARNRLGVCYFEAGRRLANTWEPPVDVERARAFLEDAGVLWRGILTAMEESGLEAPDLEGMTLLNLAILDKQAPDRDLSHALARLREARRLFLENFGPDHPELPYVDVAECEVHRTMGDPDKALELAESARRRVLRLYGESNPFLLDVERTLMWTGRSAGEWQLVLDSAERVLALLDGGLVSQRQDDRDRLRSVVEEQRREALEHLGRGDEGTR